MNSTLCRHKRKGAKDSRNEGNPTVSRCGSADSCWSQKGSNNSHVRPRRAEDRHTSEGELEVEGVWIYPGVSERCSNCSLHLVALLSSILPIVEPLTVKVMALCTVAVRMIFYHLARSDHSLLFLYHKILYWFFFTYVWNNDEAHTWKLQRPAGSEWHTFQ